MSARHHVFLVPGFFGFVNLGQVVYFAHVRDVLHRAFHRRGVEAAIEPVALDPTASLRARAAQLVGAIAAADPDGPIHLIGHSTGGLDARLAVTPGARLPTELPVEQIVSDVQTVTTIATPHQGTPLASFFSTLYGKHVLRLLSLATVYALRFGRLPLSALLRLGALFVRLDDHLGWRKTVADQLYDHLLHDFNPERRAAVRAFLEQTSRDQRLVAQLTPEGIDVFNAAATDRDGVRYYSVVTIAPRPGLRSAARIGLDPYGQATHALFAALHRLAGRSGDAVAAEASVPQRAELQRALGSLPGPRDNDGIVPTWSQPWGEVVSAARADHLDVIGHFDATDDSAPETHYDWFASGAGFDRDAFEALWDQIAARLLPA